MTDIALLVRIHPKISETFILAEILGLERLGMKLSIYSLYQPTDALTHAANADVQALVNYARTGGWRDAARLAAIHTCLLIRHPLRYAAALGFVATRVEPGRVRDFLNAGWLGFHMGRSGLRHVHAHFAAEPAAVAEIAARLTGYTYSISAHAKDIYTSTPETLRRKLASARFTVTCTEYNRRHLQAVAARAEQIHRCYHGVDTKRFSPPDFRIVDTPPRILGIGRLRPKKGFDVLIDACRLLADRGLAFQCEIVGYGPESENLKSRIAHNGLSGSVRLAGTLPQETVISRYARASLFVLPCQIAADGDRDGIPNVLVEAMAMQVPVVSTSVSGIPELIVDGENGLLCPAGDAAALADAMQRLLTDRRCAERLAARARATVTTRFDSRSNLSTLYQLLMSVMDERDVSAAPAAISARQVTAPDHLGTRG